MSIGDNVRRLREEKHYTQKELADAVYVTPSMICQIERGTKTLTAPLCKDIATFLKCSIDELMAE